MLRIHILRSNWSPGRLKPCLLDQGVDARSQHYIIELALTALHVLLPSRLWWFILLHPLLHTGSRQFICMPLRRRPDASDQTSIRPFLRPKQSIVQIGHVINVADTDDEVDGSVNATPGPSLTRRRIVINDDDDDVQALIAAPSQPLQPSVPAAVATPTADRYQPNFESHRAAATSRPDVVESPAAVPLRECDLDACNQYEDEVFGSR